jgi:peptidoglycan/xylan/chitin deacetylase (PgdA/CDA1 family)
MKLGFIAIVIAIFSSTPAVATVDTYGARYSVTIDSYFCDYQQFGYPAECPQNPHTSGVFSVVHNDNNHLWTLGSFASPGLKELAETGSTTTIRGEWVNHTSNGHALSTSTRSGISGVGSTTFQIEVNQDFSLYSFATMLAPSPDWFVGLDMVELWDSVQNGWVDELHFDLNALDAGTDGGAPTQLPVTYFDRPNDPLDPPTVIQHGRDTSAVWRETQGIIGKVTIKFVEGFRQTLPPANPSSPVTFTFAFDDTFKDGLEMASYLDELNWHGTFYISALRLCLHPAYLTREDVNSLYRRGHQIGGHSLSHSQMLDLNQNALNTQICCNRALISEYFRNPTTFAYPFAHYNHTIRRAVQKCGYCNARSTSDGLKSVRCPTCDPAESIPPEDKWRMRSYSIPTTDTFEDLKKRIDDALASETHKWVIFNFHKLCAEEGDKCNTRYRYSILKKDYLLLVNYLKELEEQGLVEVKTVKKVMHVFNAIPPSVPRSYQITFDSDEISILDTHDGSNGASTLVSLSSVLALCVLSFLLLA